MGAGTPAQPGHRLMDKLPKDMDLADIQPYGEALAVQWEELAADALSRANKIRLQFGLIEPAERPRVR
jgi:hypothetical protein